jgi:hypothetical protein
LEVAVLARAGVEKAIIRPNRQPKTCRSANAPFGFSPIVAGKPLFAAVIPRGASRMAGTPVANALDKALRECRDMDAAVNERLACYAQAVHRLTPDFAAAVAQPVAAAHRS